MTRLGVAAFLLCLILVAAGCDLAGPQTSGLTPGPSLSGIVTTPPASAVTPAPSTAPSLPSTMPSAAIGESWQQLQLPASDVGDG